MIDMKNGSLVRLVLMGLSFLRVLIHMASYLPDFTLAINLSMSPPIMHLLTFPDSMSVTSFFSCSGVVNSSFSSSSHDMFSDSLCI